MRPTRSPRSSARRRAISTTACASRSSERADRQEAFVRAREILAPVEDSPERQEALRLLADRLDLPRETLAGLAPRGRPGSPRARADTATPRLLEAGLQRERDLLAAVVRNPSLVPELAALTPEHFDDPLHRRFREVLVSDGARGRGARRVARGARRARGPGRSSTSARGRSSCCGCTNGGCGASSRAPISSARRSSKPASRRCTSPSPSSSEP